MLNPCKLKLNKMRSKFMDNARYAKPNRLQQWGIESNATHYCRNMADRF